MKKNKNIKLYPKILIISQLRPDSFEKKNNHILFSSEGCKLYKNSKKYKYELYKNSKVLDYKIKFLDKKFDYLQGVYEILLEELTIKLNKIHNVSYSTNYWRILIGVWLYQFISVIFYNWKKLDYINSNFLIKYAQIAKFKNEIYYFKDFNDFSYSLIDDKINNQINRDLLNYFKNIRIRNFLINNKKYNKKKITFSISLLLNFFKNILLNFLLNIFYLKSKKRIMFYETYFSKIIVVILQIRKYQFPLFFKSPTFKNISINKKIRKQKFNYTNDNFLNILKDIIFKYMPASYLENFKEYKKKAEIINWPKRPRYVYTSNAIFHDDFFNLWLAMKKENSNLKLISGQHGGNFYISKFNFHELHQKKISDQILTWGYKKENFHTPLFNFKTLNKKIRPNYHGNLLMFDYELPRFDSGSLVYNNFSHLAHFESKCNFINRLDNNIRNKLLFRPYHDFGWNTLERIKEINKFIKIDKNINPHDSLNNSRVSVVNLNGTVFLELLNLNFPFVIFFDPKQDYITDEAKPYFDILEKSNIYFKDSLSAAQHLNNIWDNVDKWWYSKKTQYAVSYFCNKYSKRTNHPIKDLVSVFK